MPRSAPQSGVPCHAGAVKAYLTMANERASVRKANDDRKAYLAAREKK